MPMAKKKEESLFTGLWHIVPMTTWDEDCGLAFEDDRPDTLAEALTALEEGLAAYFEREGIEIE